MFDFYPGLPHIILHVYILHTLDETKIWLKSNKAQILKPCLCVQIQTHPHCTCVLLFIEAQTLLAVKMSRSGCKQLSVGGSDGWCTRNNVH